MISIPSSGGYDKLHYEQLPDCGYTQSAQIKLHDVDEANCVTVETHACGINYADVITRWGLYQSAKDYVGWPITPGFEFSGTIKTVGANVTDFKVGDKVAGVSLFGAYSQCIMVESHMIRKVPEELSMSEAAGFLAVGCTAYYAVVELCKLRKGDKVLVHSAAGGVGSMLVQMLHNIGCYIVGVVGGTHKVEAVKQLGCDEVIDKSVSDLWKKSKELCNEGYKVVFDANGIDTLQESYNHLSTGGRLISYGAATLMPRSTNTSNGTIGMFEWVKLGWRAKHSPLFNPLNMVNDNKSVMAFNLSYLFDDKVLIKEALDELFTWMGDGTLKVSKVTEYTLKDVAKAHRDLESGKTIGKMVLLTHPVEKEETGEEVVKESTNESEEKKEATNESEKNKETANQREKNVETTKGNAESKDDTTADKDK